MRRLALLSVVFAASCSSADFDVAAGSEDSATTLDSEPADSEPVDSGVMESGPADTDPGVVDASGPCEPIQHSSTDVYVDARAAAGGLGSVGCPFRTLEEAASTSFGTGYDRIVHVRSSAEYRPSSWLKIRSRETYVGEGGAVKLYGASKGFCPSSTKTCAIAMEGTAGLKNFVIDASSVANGIFVAATGTTLSIKNTTVTSAMEEGIYITGTGALLGPDVNVVQSGSSALFMKGNALLKVSGLGNAFNTSKNNGAGIHMMSGMLLLEGGTSTLGNHVGVLFDAAGGSASLQSLTQLTAQLNRTSGVVVNKGWAKVTIRKSELTRNTNYGLRLEYNTARSNVFDLGESSVGGNVFGGLGTRNGKAGIIMCGTGPTGSIKADGNSWTTCPSPSQELLGGCDGPPTSHVDIAYFPNTLFGSTTGLDPVATPTTCTVGP